MRKDAWKALCDAANDPDRTYGCVDPKTNKVYVGYLTTAQRVEQFHLKLANEAILELLYREWASYQR